MAEPIQGLPVLTGGKKGKGESKWLVTFANFIDQLRIQSKEVASDDPRGSPLHLWGSQRIYLDQIVRGMDAGVRDFYCLKSRQLGISTVSVAIDVFWMGTHPGILGVLVADHEGNRDFFRETFRNYHDSLPKDFVGDSFRMVKDNEKYMTFSNGSRLDFLVAGAKKKTWGEGRGYTLGHMCMAKGSHVVVEHGRVKRIEDVMVGEKMLTHNGQETTVVDVFGQPGAGKRIIRVRPWLGHAVDYTEWHKIPTARGLLQAKDLLKTDLLVMPIRPISGDCPVVTLPPSKGRFATNGAAGGGEMPLTEEVGFALGYYLAEGCMIRNSPCGLSFTRHRSEKGYSDRAIEALTPYGTPLAEWLDQTFGSGDGKHIPDAVFSWGRPFCRGLLCGVLAGGSRYATSQMVLPTTRSSLAMQTRDLAASLGYGWASLSFKDGGNHYGRNCKPYWRVSWNGLAAQKLRELVGLPVIERSRHDFTNKYTVEDGRVLIKIRSIEDRPCEEEVWDISVDHVDHTFRLPSMSTSNTEVAKYGTAEGIASFREALATNNPDRLFMWESTAFGFNHWKDMCQEAESDEYTKRFFFIGWWSKELNTIPRADRRFGVFGLTPPDGEEREKIRLVKGRHGVIVSMEQLAWRRARDADTSTAKADLDQNQPWLQEEAFVQSGFSFFQPRVLGKLLDKICAPDSGVIYIPYRFHLGAQLHESRMDPIPTDEVMLARGRDLDIVELRVWEQSVEGAKYSIGMDPAYGRNDWKDRHAISVWRCFADMMVQVAEYADSRVDTYQAAWVLAYLAGVYKDCLINIELTGPGRAVFTEFDQKRNEYRSEGKRIFAEEREWDNFLGTAQYFLYHRPDSMGAGYAYHTEMQYNIKSMVCNQFRDALMTNALVIRSAVLLNEMMSVVQDGSEIAAPGNMKDDRVFAAILACMAWKQWIQPAMIMSGDTYDKIMTEARGENNAAKSAINHIVHNFWKTRTEMLENPPEPAPTYFDDRGI